MRLEKLDKAFEVGMNQLPLGTLGIMIVLPAGPGDVQFISNVNNEGVIKACKATIEHLEKLEAEKEARES